MEDLLIKQFADDTSANNDHTIIRASFADNQNAQYTLVLNLSDRTIRKEGYINSQEDYDREVKYLESLRNNLDQLIKYLNEGWHP